MILLYYQEKGQILGALGLEIKGGVLQGESYKLLFDSRLHQIH